jgi:hypothetical protein
MMFGNSAKHHGRACPLDVKYPLRTAIEAANQEVSKDFTVQTFSEMGMASNIPGDFSLVSESCGQRFLHIERFAASVVSDRLLLR